MRLKLNPLTTSGVSVVEPVTVIAGSGGSSTSSTGVSSLAKSGDTALTGSVTLSGGSNVTLTQAGQNIEIAASGSTGVASVVAGGNIDVDATDPANPIVSVETLTLADISDVTASVTEVNYTDGVTSSIQTQLDGKVDENGAIVGATKTKITYDAKGLVTAGADATTADIADSLNKRYVTDAQLTVIGNTSGTNTGDVTVSDSSEIDLTLTGQQISASIVAGSIDETKLDTSVNASLDLADSSIQNLAGLGITATAAELNIMDGVTSTTAELNYTDGVTSAIQTQLDNKQPLDSDLTTIAGLTATTDNFIQSVASAWASRTPAQAAVALGKVLYPVGIILELTVSTDPATLFGFGTWAAFGTGRVTVAIDAGQTEFDTNGETGGAKTHTLTTSEMPAHTHSMGEVSTTKTRNFSSFGTDNGVAASVNTGSTGGGGAHNNLQPYIVVYRWQRTA